jgi:ABC-type sugar transport system ATPase subunit
LRQIGTPQELFYHPVDVEVARFFGGCNFFQGVFKNGIFDSELGKLPVPKPSTVNGHQVTATIRPENILISAESTQGVEGRVTSMNFEGSTTRVRIAVKEKEYIVLTTEQGFSPGQIVNVSFPPEKIRIFLPKNS